MFHHPAWAVATYCMANQPGGTPQIQLNPTQVCDQMGHPVQYHAEAGTLFNCRGRGFELCFSNLRSILNSTVEDEEDETVDNKGKT